jgi:TRAP-type C4-dicarboxylate transport system permease large subunit
MDSSERLAGVQSSGIVSPRVRICAISAGFEGSAAASHSAMAINALARHSHSESLTATVTATTAVRGALGQPWTATYSRYVHAELGIRYT